MNSFPGSSSFGPTPLLWSSSSSYTQDSKPKYFWPQAPAQIPLFHMALYDGMSPGSGGAHPPPPPVMMMLQEPFHLLRGSSDDDYKELTLKEILDLSEDLLADDTEYSEETEDLYGEEYDDDPLMTTPIMEPPPEFDTSPPVLSSHLSMLETSSPVLSSPTSSSMDIVHPISPATSRLDDDNDDDDDDSSTNKKRSRRLSSSRRSSGMCPRFREYQAGQWSRMFDELLAYSKKHGDCMVPYTYKDNKALARWVKRNRYQYKLWKEHKPSTMTLDRARALEQIGFCWDSQTSNWMDRLAELKAFKEEHGHCNIPSQYVKNPQLSTWAKCQRRQVKLLKEGKPYNITPQRIEELNKLGFCWELRAPRKQRDA